MYNAQTLKPKIIITPMSVECPVLGCKNNVERQRRSFRCEVHFQCPKHHIFISPSTFEYPEELENILFKNATDQTLLNAIKKVKRESRMARDNSEDALTWNVFRYLDATNQMDDILTWFTGKDQQLTELIYWSYSRKVDNTLPMLNITRKYFGEHLQRSSEPDLIAVTDKALFFIEAKLTANNDTKPSNPKEHKKYLSDGEGWFRKVFVSEYEQVAIQAKKYELMRFWLLGSWMADQMERDFYLVNLVPSARETDIEERFKPYIRLSVSRQFKRLAWEDIYYRVATYAHDCEEKRLWMDYIENKTVGYDGFHNLQKAFSLLSRT